MNHTLKTALAMTAAVCVACAGAAAIAQDGPPAALRGGGQGFQGGPGGQGLQDGPGGRGDPQMRLQRMGQRLGLRPDQQQAFQAFVAASAPPAGGPQAMQGLTTPQRLDRQLAELQARVAATKRFYAVLTPEQRQTFDSMPMMMAMGPGGRGGPGG